MKDIDSRSEFSKSLGAPILLTAVVAGTLRGRMSNEPDIVVLHDPEGRRCLGFVEESRQRAGVLEARVRYTTAGTVPDNRLGWFPYDQLEPVDPDSTTRG
jgi:hypothetical protein